MENKDDVLSNGEFAQAAESFGYHYSRVSPNFHEAGGHSEMFEGRVGFHALPFGVSLYSSDLQSLRESEHDGMVPRSLTIAVSLAGVTADCAFGSKGRLHLKAGTAAVVSVSDSARLVNRVEAGQYYRGLLVRTRPEDLLDEEVAERVEKLLRATEIAPMEMSGRSALLAQELFSPLAEGCIGRLFAESCALELLARALQTTSHLQEDRLRRVSSPDRAKLLAVRDRIVAEPERAYSLSQLARDAGLSVSALKAKFPEVFGQTVFAFLRDVRMERARDGIELEGWSVSQAAYFVGYRHQSNFSTAFRRKFGVAPSALRHC